MFGSVDRAFVRMFEMWPGFRWPVSTARHWLSEVAIPVDEFHRDGDLVIRAGLPGVDPEKDVELTVSGGMLHIRAERHEEHDVGHGRYLRHEISCGSFERDLPLPDGVTDTDVKATYRDGILEVVVPRGEHDTRKVAIST